MNKPKIDENQLPVGLEVATIYPDPGGYVTISDRNEFSYYLYNLRESESVKIDHLLCSSVFLPLVNNSLQEISVNGKAVKSGDSALVELSGLLITAVKGSGNVLIAGSKKATPGAKKQTMVQDRKKHYIVTKPWGHELWINGEHPVFSFKEVFLKEGFRTSLQYHNCKVEAAVLYQGICEIIYKSNSKIDNDRVLEGDIGRLRLNQMGKICVEPKVLHRMVAVTEMYQYEVSTPDLDDVVRVHDDNKRGHGRIRSEHNKSL